MRRTDGRARGSRTALAGAALLLASCLGPSITAATAQAFRYTATLDARETFTNNVNLTPDETRRSDWVTELTPTVGFDEKGGRTLASGFISLPVLLYAHTGAENNNVYPRVSLLGDVDLYEKIFHVEGAVDISQQYFSPFGGVPPDLTNATQNRYRSSLYRLTPYLKGTTTAGVDYELRNNNVWTNLSGAPISTDNSYYSEWIARADKSQGRQLGWRADYDFTEVRFNQQSPIRTQLGRLVGVWNPTGAFELSASVGYESNDYALTSSSNSTYGVGFHWRPTPRTDVVGNWEHRFFGSSYLLTASHRTPLSVWSVDISRNITTYPQQVASLAAGTRVASYLNQLYLSSIPDPVARQEVVDRLIRDRGLPDTLDNPVTIYSQQVLLEERQSFVAGLIGARNTLFLTVYNVRNQPISAEGNPLPPALTFSNDNTQTGYDLVWTYRLTATANLVTTGTALRTVNNVPNGETTRQYIVHAELSTPVGARTTALVGARYQDFRSDFALSSYTETAAYVGIRYRFK